MGNITYEKYTVKEAKKRDLIQLYKWQPLKRLQWLESEMKRIGGDGTRIALIVMKNSKYTLFVDDAVKKSKAKPK